MPKSRQRVKLHSDGAERGAVTRAIRSLGPSQRRSRRGGPRPTQASPDEGSADHRRRVLYWMGDERETTQGDW